MATSYVPTKTGLRLHVTQQGAGMPILFLHGFGEASFVWDQIVADLGEGYRCVTLDFRGHGESDHDPEGRYDQQRYAEDVSTVVRDLGFARPIFVGHSLGAAVAARLASARADLRGLVLVDYNPDTDPDTAEQVRTEFRAAFEGFASPEAYARRQVEVRPLLEMPVALRLAVSLLKRDDDGLWRPKADIRLADARPPGAFERDFQIKGLAQLRCPIRLVRGMGSAVLPLAAAKRLVGTSPNWQLAEVPAAGHGLILDNPSASTRVITTLIRELSKTA